jgi:magnesium transporter
MIRILYRHRSGSALAELPFDQLRTAVADKQLSLWIDMDAPSAEESRLVLEEIFRFHPLVIEDAVKDMHVPKIDDFGAYVYVVFHSISAGSARMDLHSAEIDCFLGPNYLITMHDERCEAIEKCWSLDYHRRNGLARGPALLLYELLDRQTENYVPLIHTFEERIEQLGDAIFRNGKGSHTVALDDLLTAKSSALRLYRVLIPQRELLHQLSANSYAQIPNEARLYFRDVYDHQLQIADLVISMRDLVTSTIETYLALTGNRMNEVMKVLTIISTLFMPLSFVAGIYGMNFEFMPELHQPWAYPMLLVVLLLIALGMLISFRRRGWL